MDDSSFVKEWGPTIKGLLFRAGVGTPQLDDALQDFYFEFLVRKRALSLFDASKFSFPYYVKLCVNTFLASYWNSKKSEFQPEHLHTECGTQEFRQFDLSLKDAFSKVVENLSYLEKETGDKKELSYSDLLILLVKQYSVFDICKEYGLSYSIVKGMISRLRRMDTLVDFRQFLEGNNRPEKVIIFERRDPDREE